MAAELHVMVGVTLVVPVPSMVNDGGLTAVRPSSTVIEPGIPLPEDSTALYTCSTSIGCCSGQESVILSNAFHCVTLHCSENFLVTPSRSSHPLDCAMLMEAHAVPWLGERQSAITRS